MKRSFHNLVALLAALMAVAWANADPAIAINPGNSETIDYEKIASALVGKRKFWDNGSEIVIAVLRGNENANKVLVDHAKMDEGRFKSYWQRLAFSGRGRMPRFFDSPEELLSFVSSHKGAIGVLDSAAANGAVKIVY